jgi:hypothetical protein
MAMNTVIARSWPDGIYDPRPYAGAHEIKMHGMPWRTSYTGKSEARRLMCNVFEALYDRGWIAQSAIDISNKRDDKGELPSWDGRDVGGGEMSLTASADSLIFRQQGSTPPPCEWLSIGFDRDDRLKFVPALPADLIQALLRTFGSSVSRHETPPGYVEFKFHGSPWTPHGSETVMTRLMVLQMMATLEQFGWSLYVVMNQVSGHEGQEADVMYLQRRKDWVPGAPIFHR